MKPKVKVAKYPTYKDSGVEWLGEIPEHWEVRRLKTVCLINQNSLPENTNKDHELKYVDIGNVSLENGVLQTETFSFKNSPSRARRIARIDDTIISTVRTYLKAIDYIDSEKSNYIYSTGFAVLEPIAIIPKYLAFCVRSECFTNQVMVNSKGMSYPAINSSEIAKLQITLPPPAEQTRIAVFLDKKTAQIDQAIAQKERQIELLKERTQILIHNAVTRGLNPNVKMKDSGVEWIGKIPEHWEVSRLKNHVELLTGFPFKSEKYTDHGIKLVRGINVKEGELNWNDTRCWPSISKELEEYSLESGDVLIAMDGSKVGKNVCIVRSCDLPLLLLQRVARLRVYSTLNADFLFYNLICKNFLDWVLISKTDPMVPHIAPSDIHNFLLCIPPVSEQQQIAESVAKCIQNSNRAVAACLNQIEKLKEYKATLINAAVTGKISII